MKITYLEHSGFLVELPEGLLLFDYIGGPLPALPEDRPLFIFISHSHADHFSAEVFTEFSLRPGTRYFVSDEVRTPRIRADVTRMAPHEEAVQDGLCVKTLGSTDEGVSFLVSLGGRRIFHMGDLNWWDWGEEDTPEEAAQMERDYRAELALLSGPVDLAFVPVDPRLGEGFYKGIDALMRTAQVAAAVPMHCWGEADMADRLAALACSKDYIARVHALTRPGDTLILED